MANELQVGFEQDGYRYIGGDPADQRSWESSKLKSGTIDSGYRYLGGDPSNQSNWEDVRSPGLIDRVKEGVKNTAAFLKASATEDPEEIAKIVAERQRTQLPTTEAGVRVAGAIRKSADEMKGADQEIDRASAAGDLFGATRGVVNSMGVGVASTAAKSLLSEPKETLGMIAENLPNSAPGIAGGLAGGAVGAATPIPGGAIIGGVVGGTAGGYNVEKGGALYEQIVKEAQARGIDPTDETALKALVAEKKDEFIEKAKLKGIGTAGTDAVLNAATFGLAGAAERTLVRSANQIGKRMADGTIDAATGAAQLAELEAKNAARNTLGAKVARGGAVTAAEMGGESASEYAGQKLAYGEVDPTDVVLEGLLGAGQGVGMAAGRGMINKAGQAVGLENFTDVEKAIAEASKQREVTAGDIMKAQDIGTAVDAAVQAADLDLQTSLVPELASDIDAYNAATLRAPALNPSDALELAAAKGAMDRVGSLDLSQPAPIAAPASAVNEAGDSAARAVEAAGGVATPAQAAMLDRAFPGQKMYDQVVGSSEQVPTVGNQSPIITDTGRAPRETVRFDNPMAAENAEGWNRWNADRQPAAPATVTNEEQIATPAPAVNVGNVIEALQTAPALQSAEQRVTLNAARQNLSAEDFQLLETAAQGRFNLSAEQKIRLNALENNAVFPQNQETTNLQENSAKLSTDREQSTEQATELPKAEVIYSPTPMGDGYRLVGQQNINGRQMYIYADRSVTPSVTPDNTQSAMPNTGTTMPEMGTNVPDMGTTSAAGAVSPKSGIATLEATVSNNDQVGTTGTVTSEGKTYNFNVVDSGAAPGVYGAIRQFARLFGKKVVFFTSDLAADGFVQPGKGSAIYINANSKMSPLAVFGHELMHLLKRDNPIAYKAVAAVVGRNLKGDAASKFRDYYNAEGPSQNSELTDAELEEMVADLMGNEFTQESFLSDVFNEIGQMAPEGQARSIILRLAATINKAIKAALNVIKGMPVSQAFDTDQMVNNLEEIRAALKSALKTYAIQQKESAAKMAMEFTREENTVDLTGATLSPRRVPLSTRTIMEQEPGKARTGLGLVENPGRSDNKVREVAQKLNERTQKHFGIIDDKDTSEEAKMKLAKAMADEVAYQLGTTADTGTGLGWYSVNYPNAVKKLARVFPEFEYSKPARDLFSAIVAVTSNGEKVSINIANAIKFYKTFRDTGSLTGSGVGARRAGALDANIENLEALIERHGLKNLSTFLMEEMTVGQMNAELRKMGEKTDSSYTADTVVPRAALHFGPKLGAFYANLMGAEGYLTMDLWWSRTFNRMRGVLIPSATEQSIQNFGELIGKPNASKDEIVQATIEPRNAYEERNYKTELEVITGEKEPGNKAGKELWMMKAKKASGDRFDELLKQQRIEKTANTIYKNEFEGLAEAPFRASDRKFMWETTLVVQKLLKRKYGKLSIADIQAALWYYEKRLYATLSGGQANDIGYEEAILEHAKSDRPERPSAYFNRESDQGNDGERAGEVSGRALGSREAEPAKLSKARVNFEVAPDPNDVTLAGAWNSVSVEKRYDISKAVAEKLIPQAMKALGVTGKLTSQTGSYLDDTNVSFALQLDQSDKADTVQKFMGFVLSQDSMMTVSSEDFSGSERVGAVTVQIGDADPAKVYQQLRAIKVDGEQIVGGQSTANGQMVILNYSSVSTDKLAELINKKLKDKYTVNIDEVFASFPSKEEYGYASDRSQGAAATEGSPLQRDANYLRGEATKLVREALRDAGAKFSPARSDAASSGRDQGSNAEAARGVVEYGQPTEGSVTAVGVHYSRQERLVLDGRFHGTGLRGEEARRLAEAKDNRLKSRIYFYVDSGKGIKPEAGVGSYPHQVKLNNVYDANKTRELQNAVDKTLTGNDWFSAFESAVIDAGYDGYLVNFGNQRAAVLIGKHTIDLTQKPEQQEAKLSPPRFYSQLERAIEQVPSRLTAQPAAQWKAWLASNSAKFGIKKDEIEWSGINDYLDLRGKDKVTSAEIASFLDLNNVKIDEVVKGDQQKYWNSVYDQLESGETVAGYHWDGENLISRYDDIVSGVADLGDATDMVVERSSDSDAKYAQYTLEGGRNYREMLLTLPERLDVLPNGWSIRDQGADANSQQRYVALDEDGNVRSYAPDQATAIERASKFAQRNTGSAPTSYNSSHWDEPNILAHIRMNDRTDANGSKVLFVEEIQSDWAQQGRKTGFGNVNGFRVVEPSGQLFGEYSTKADAESALARAKSGSKVEVSDNVYRGTPDAPFVKSTKDWVALAVKRVMLLAAQGNYDKVAFVNGQQSADRYNLAKQIDYIEYEKTDTNEWFIKAMDHTGRSAVTEYGQTPEKLESLVGKEIAQKIVNNEGTREPGEPATYGVLRNTQLSVGGEGMKSFYDRIVPQVVNDVLKKLGGRTEPVSLEHDPNKELDQWVPEDGDGDGSKADISKTEQVGFSVTPDMREKLQGEGLPLFSKQRYNASGNLIYPTQNGQDNFWKWIDGIRRGGLETPGVSGEGRGRAESASARTAGLGDRFFFDDAGRPKVLFHGTTTAIDEFDLDHPNKKDAGWLGKGVYLTSDIDMAEGYANLKGSMRNQTIMPVYAYLRNPYLFTADEKQALSKAGKDAIAAFTKSAQAKGYDGGVLEFDDGTYEVVAFNNTQVKSASGNDGSFDLNSAKLSTSRQSVADALAGQEFKQEMVNQIKFKLADIIAPGNGFNWFHKTVGTQFHKAKVNPLFKKVFDLGQQFLDDVTLFATRAEDKAADLFPRFGLSKTLLKTGLSKADNQLIGKALAEGTLENGPNPHDGVVWTDDQLRTKYGMNDQQIGYYRQARASLDQSLDDLAKSEMATHMRIAMKANITPLIRADLSLQQVRDMLVQALDTGIATTNNADATKMLQKTRSQINGIYSTTTNLKNHGYAPLMRFGNYTVTAYDENGEVSFFQMTDTKSEASLMAKNLESEFDKVVVGKMSQEAHKLFKGITPDTLELFAKHAALPNDALTQEYLQLAVSSRSVMKRLINRKGTTGYSLDATRTLATFLTSNARKSSSALNMSDMKQAADAIPREDGDVKDEAVKLVEYLQNPGEEAAKLRGFLFFQYLGGSIASGIVNLTQPILQTYPYLAQFGAGKAGAAMKTGTVAATHFLRGKRVGDPVLQAAMEKAKAEGLIDPQEIYQLMAASQSGAGSFLSYKLMRLWGINFGVTELMNRAVTFAAAFKIGQTLSKEELAKAGAKDAYSFAQGAIYETQGLYNKGNRPDWARGAVGGTVFTFKQYSISYLEFLTRLYKNDKKAFGIALAILIMAAGLQGLPGADDLDDVIDTAGNWMGYATNSKKWKREFLEDILGKEMAAFAMHGVSTIPGMPIDVQARLGLGNIIPGTGLLNPARKDKGREVAEVFGVAGGLAMSTLDTTEALARGDIRRAAMSILPGSLRNLMQAAEMASTGEYRDTRGRLVQKVDATDVVAKAIGFQPAEIAAGNRRMREVQSDIDIVKAKQEEVNGKYARAVVDKDQEAMAEVRNEMKDWNQKNPDLRIKFNMSAIQQRVKQARLTKDARFIKSAPQQIRQQVRQAVLAD